MSTSFQHSTMEEKKVSDLVQLLGGAHQKSNKVQAIRQFEEFFFEAKPRLSAEYIRLLFQGDNGSTKEGGLIQTAGDFARSHVASRAALGLLCRLLDLERNKDANFFIDIFVALDVSSSSSSSSSSFSFLPPLIGIRCLVLFGPVECVGEDGAGRAHPQ